MSRCEEIQKELDAYLKDEINASKRVDIEEHLVECEHCSKILNELKKLSILLQKWPAPESSPLIYEKLKARIDTHQPFCDRIFTIPFAKKFILRLAEVLVIGVLTLLVSRLLNKPVSEPGDQLTTINFYLKEHQNVVTKNISSDISEVPAARMQLNRNDILYYEFLDQFPEYSRPGIILRTPTAPARTNLTRDPVIANGKELTLSQVGNEVNFSFIAPPNFHPGYILENIRKIEGRNSLHLLYSNDINTISLFEQSVEENQRLVVEDFREYAVFQNKGQSGSTILAWNDKILSYVLIGNSELSHLMDIAQHINNIKRKE